VGRVEVRAREGLPEVRQAMKGWAEGILVEKPIEVKKKQTKTYPAWYMLEVCMEDYTTFGVY
jgi:hypothetical protein